MAELTAPYYDSEGVVIYNADCRDLLPSIDVESVALLATDPPYGMAYKPLRGGDGSKRFSEGVEGDSEPFDPSHLLRFPRLVLFGANWYADKLPPSGGWVMWDKTPRGIKEGFYASHGELAWTNLCGSVRKFAMQWGGEAHGGEHAVATDRVHATRRPCARPVHGQRADGRRRPKPGPPIHRNRIG